MGTVQALQVALDVSLPEEFEEALQAKERRKLEIQALQTNVRRLEQEHAFLGTELNTMCDNWDQETDQLALDNTKLRKQLTITKAQRRVKRRR